MSELFGKELYEFKTTCAGCKAFAQSNYDLISERDSLRKELVLARQSLEEALDYMAHMDHCILNYWESGEPTSDGGYRVKYRGKWYQTRPVDETPKCNCGLDNLMDKINKREEGGGK